MSEPLETLEPAANEPRSAPLWLRLLDLVPAAWLLLVLYAYALLVFNHGEADRTQMPGASLTEALALPLLCLLGIAAIIRHLYLRKGRSRPSPAIGEGESTL